MVHSKKSNTTDALSGSEFKQLLWRAGFVTTFGGQVCVDIQRSCDYLSCSERTLRRWFTGSPCPRAVSLLRLKERALPDSWDGFSFNRQERLVTPFHSHGLEKDAILLIGRLSKDATRFEEDAKYYKAQLESVRNESAIKNTRTKLAHAITTLQAVMADPMLSNLSERQNYRVR